MLESSSETPHASQQCPIILVHGTWGRGFFPSDDVEELSEKPMPGAGRWFDHGSEFRQALESALRDEPSRYVIRSLLWSGSNSVFARDAAASRLADELEKDLERQDAMPVVIAHSHGGNVAMRALRHLRSDPSRIRIITLATPFVRVFVQGEPTKLSGTVWLLILGAVFGVTFTFVVACILFASTALSSYASMASTYVMLLVGAVLALIVSILIVHQLNAIFVKSRDGPDDADTTPLALQRAASYSSVGGPGASVLVIRGVDDEASLALAAGSIGSRLSSLVLANVIPGIYTAGLVAIFLLVMLLNIDEERAVMLEMAVAIGCSVGALAFLGLPGVFKSTFGKEFLTTAFACEIAADSTPDACGSLDVITLSPSTKAARRQLRHGIYAHPECVNEIVRWLRKMR